MGSAAPKAGRLAACWACCGPSTLAADLLPLRIYECPRCGLGFQADRCDELGVLYDDSYFSRYDGGKHYARADASRRLEARVRRRFVQRFVRRGRLLEIGAAAGHFLAEARRAGFDVQGVEPSIEMARLARELHSVDVVACRIEEFELAEASLDAVCGWHVLEHVPDPLVTLERLRDALRPDGLVFFEVPNYASARARRERATWQYLDPLHHVAQYTPTAIRMLLERVGFEPLEVVTVPWGVYKRPARALLSYGRQAFVVGTSTFRPSPWKHELLRAVARRPRPA